MAKQTQSRPAPGVAPETSRFSERLGVEVRASGPLASEGPTLAAAERLGHRLERLAPPVGGPPIQRTIHKWNGKAWEVHQTTTADKDEHPAPEDHDFEHDPEPGDLYDQDTGVHHRRAEGARGRLERSASRYRKRADRAARQAEKAPEPTKISRKRKRAEVLADQDFAEITEKRGNRKKVETPFGPMRFGRGMFNTQPLGTFSPDDWGEKRALPGHNYDHFVSGLEGSANRKGILDEIDDYLADDETPKASKHAKTAKEKEAATGLAGLLSVAEPHVTRNPVGGKPERAAIRRAKKVGVKRVFNRKEGEYPPAWATAGGAKIGGTGAWREMREGKREIPMGAWTCSTKCRRRRKIQPPPLHPPKEAPAANRVPAPQIRAPSRVPSPAPKRAPSPNRLPNRRESALGEVNRFSDTAQRNRRADRGVEQAGRHCRRRPRICSGEFKLGRVPGKILENPRDNEELAMKILKFRHEVFKFRWEDLKFGRQDLKSHRENLKFSV